MKVSAKGLGLSLVVFAAILSGCSASSEETVSSTASSGSSHQATSAQSNISDQSTTFEKNEKSLIQAAFDVNVDDISPETEQISDEKTQNTYAVNGGKIVVEWTNNEIPTSLYYFKDENDTNPPETYQYPDTIETDAKSFVSDVLGITASDALGIYGYQNRIGVLLTTGDGEYFHIQFMPESNSVIGYQSFEDENAADTFYETQKAEKLS